MYICVLYVCVRVYLCCYQDCALKVMNVFLMKVSFLR